jgi:hypothetical protein
VRITANSIHFMPRRAEEGAGQYAKSEASHSGQSNNEETINPEDIAWQE